MLKNTDRTLRSGMQPPALHCFGSRPYHLEMMLAEASHENSTDGSGMSDRVAYGALGPWGLDAGRCREQKRLAGSLRAFAAKYEFLATVPFRLKL